MKSKNILYLPWLDHLRYFGAMLIIFYHGVQLIWHQQKYGQYFSKEHWLFSNNPFKTLIFEGHTAVALFMVISGFVLTVGLYKKNIYYFKFILNRLLRIYPLFLFTVFFLIYSEYQGASVMQFIQTLFTFGTAQNSIHVPVAWAIKVEFQFYMIFPFFLFFLNKKGIKFLVSFILFFILFRLFSGNGNFTRLSLHPIYLTIFGRIDQFLIGMILGTLYLNKTISMPEKNYKYLFFLSCFFVIFSLYIFNKFGGLPNNGWWKVLWPTYEAGIWAFFIFSYYGISKHIPNFISRVLESMGKISYSMFLTHFIIIQEIIKYNLLFMFTRENLVLNAFLNTLILIVPITLVVSCATNFLIEKPFLRLRINYKK